MENKITSILVNIPPFNQLPLDILEEVISVSEVKSYSNNQSVVNQNEKEIQSIFIILDGLAKNILLNDEYEEIIIKTYSKGDVFGLIHAMSGEGFTYSIRVINNTSILLIPITIFEKLMTLYPSFTEEVARLITTRLRELYIHIGREVSSISTVTSPLYRKKITELMSTPVVTCKVDKEIIDISRNLLNHQVSSIIVVNEQETPLGIVTEKDLIRAFTTLHKENYEKIRVKDIMKSPLIGIKPNDSYYDAIHLMVKHNIRHLPVIDDRKILLGIITMKNLIQSVTDHSFSIIKNIEKASTITELSTITKKITHVINKLLEEHATPKELTSIISEISDRTTRKIIYLSEVEMIKEGEGPPPVAYSWLSLGSEGRKEQALQTDQDNALVYANVPKESKKEIDLYFQKLAVKVVNGLEKCGYPQCSGGVMATNTLWRASTEDWIKMIKLWLNKRAPEMIRYFSTLLDFRPIYGDPAITEEIGDILIQREIPPLFLHLLAEDINQVDVAINRFGRFNTLRGEKSGLLDIKHGGLMHLVNGLRVLSLKHHVTSTNSWDRLEELYKLGIFEEDERDDILQALDEFMILRIKLNINQVRSDKELNYYINPVHCSKKDRLNLKKSLMVSRWFKLKVTRDVALPGSHLRGF